MTVAFNTGSAFAPPVAWGGALAHPCSADSPADAGSAALGIVAKIAGNGTLGIPDWDKTGMCDGAATYGAGAYFSISIGPLCLPTVLCYILINPGGDGGQTSARPEATLKDVDGDGLVDHVSSDGTDKLTVARNQTGKTDLLKRITRPLGATIDLDYERTGNTFDQPESRWVLSKTSVNDGVARHAD